MCSSMINVGPMTAFGTCLDDCSQFAEMRVLCSLLVVADGQSFPAGAAYLADPGRRSQGCD